MTPLISQLIIISILLQLLLPSTVLAETINMQYSDPNHLHAPYQVTVDGQQTTYQYDANGNLTNDGERTIEWNQDNLPVKITKGDSEIRFFYDASGRRVVKEVVGGEKTIYVNQYLTIEQLNNETIYQKYYFAQGRRIAQRVINNNNNLTIQQFSNLYFLHHDYLGSTILTTDLNSQPSSNSLSYFPYGNSLNHLTIEPFSHYLYTGQELDPESDLYNYNARLYNPKTGAFISADTVNDSFNRYAYANNNPLMFTDPTGHYRTGNAGKPDYTIDKIPIPPWIANNKDLMFKIRAGAFILSSLHPLVDITVTDTHIIVKRLTGDVAMMAMAGQLIGMTGGIENVGSPTMMEKDAIMEDMGEVVDEVEITAGNEMGHEAAVSQKEPDSFIRGVGAEPVNLSGPKPPQDSLVSINISEGLYKFTDPSTGKVTNIHLSPLEVEAVEKARVAGSTCSAHLADLGLIDVADTSRFHAALRRVALKIGLDVTPNHGWIGKLNKAISGASRTIQ